MMAAYSEARIEVAACSKAGDKAAACSGTGIEDGRWRQHRWQAAVAGQCLG
jgi:hypothetical protein